MNTENIVKQLRVLWRTDRIIADIRMRHLLVGMGLRAFAPLIAAFGLLMLELAAYFALVQFWNAISAAAILGAVNFAIAGTVFAIAARRPTGRDLELASEIHDSSIDALQIEARALQSHLSAMIHHPLNGVLPLLIVPLMTIVIKGLKKLRTTSNSRRGGHHRTEVINQSHSPGKRHHHAKHTSQTDPEYIHRFRYIFVKSASSSHANPVIPRATPTSPM